MLSPTGIVFVAARHQPATLRLDERKYPSHSLRHQEVQWLHRDATVRRAKDTRRQLAVSVQRLQLLESRWRRRLGQGNVQGAVRFDEPVDTAASADADPARASR